jgi:SpoVK/Ycf46/Vps4 family AAA+-type ATPase
MSAKGTPRSSGKGGPGGGGGGSSTLSPGSVAGSDTSTSASLFRADFQASPTPHPYAYLSPLDMTALSLLPDDEVVVSDAGTGRPLFVGPVWPGRGGGGAGTKGGASTTATGGGRGLVRIPLPDVWGLRPSPAAVSPPLLPTSPRTPVRGGGEPGAAPLSAKAAGSGAGTGPGGPLPLVTVRPLEDAGEAMAAEGGGEPPAPAPRAAAVVRVGRAPTSSSSPPAAAAPSVPLLPSLPTLLALFRGLVLPAAGSTLVLDGCAVDLVPDGGAGAGGDGDFAPPPFVYVGPATRFLPARGGAGGAPRARGPQAPSGGGHPLPSPSDAAGPSPSPSSSSSPSSPVGGLDAQLSALLDAASGALLHPSRYLASGLRPPKGALLVGPPGTGKTTLAREVAARLGVPLIVVNGPEIMSSTVGESEARLRRLFDRARAQSPALLFLDELDGLCPRRDGAGEVEARIVATLLALLDGVGGKGGVGGGGEAVVVESSARAAPVGDGASDGAVFVLGATNRASAIDPALRRPGRFDTEIAVGIPTAAQRTDILAALLARYPHALSRDEVAEIAGRLHGFVGADLAAVCREAALVALRRSGVLDGGPEGEEGETAGAPPLSPPTPSTPPLISLTADDVRAGSRRVQPSALREVAVEVPRVPWSAIGGQEEVKDRLREAVEWPLTRPEAFARLGIRPPRGVLLYGPPGCSKTMMAKAMATEGGMNFIAVKGPELFSKFVGDSEKAVAEVFARARAASPCVVFFDEFDSMAPQRGGGGGGGGDEGGGNAVSTRVVSQLLQELDGAGAGAGKGASVVLVAATNRPDLIDRALLRPGRIDAALYVGLPDASAREAIVRAQLARIPHDAAGIDPRDVAVRLLEGYTGAEVVGVVREAAVACVREAMRRGGGEGGGGRVKGGDGEEEEEEGALSPVLRLRHLEEAVLICPKQVTKGMLDFYAGFGGRKGGAG